MKFSLNLVVYSALKLHVEQMKVSVAWVISNEALGNKSSSQWRVVNRIFTNMLQLDILWFTAYTNLVANGVSFKVKHSGLVSFEISFTYDFIALGFTLKGTVPDNPWLPMISTINE